MGVVYSRVRPTLVWCTLEYATTKEECTLESKSCLESVASPTGALLLRRLHFYISLHRPYMHANVYTYNVHADNHANMRMHNIVHVALSTAFLKDVTLCRIG